MGRGVAAAVGEENESWEEESQRQSEDEPETLVGVERRSGGIVCARRVPVAMCAQACRFVRAPEPDVAGGAPRVRAHSRDIS